MKIVDESDLEDATRQIINGVKSGGDSTLIELTKRYDKVDLAFSGIKVTRRQINEAYNKVSKDQIKALQYLKERIQKVEQHKLDVMNFEINETGLKIKHILKPISSVGCYVPGGKASYPSTLLMTVVPAKLAGVPRIVVCSPPTFNNDINPLTLVATDICGVDEVYRVGGAQAIAALAYGTESIKPVDKIVGPGGKMVTIAKTLVSREVSIDIPAGPTELIILADEKADPSLIALDMISQSEHSEDNIAGLVTTSKKLTEEVEEQINVLSENLKRKEIVSKSMSNNGFIFLCGSLDEAISFINTFAPEHLEIVTDNPYEMSGKIESAGIILIGKYTPTSASDYGVGTNHVLPTSGYGRAYSGLSTFDFVRRINVVECSEEGLKKMEPFVRVLSESEGLPNHYLSLKERIKS
ncbi:MAG: histidinol dehydrogenase [Thermoproteota archaeon]|nr:histidinol dehydrogenase [Thermoproteota archaeon]